MQKLEQLYEGKAKKVFKTDDPEILMVDYKDDATAFNGEKKGTIESKGIINNKVTNHFMKMLEEKGIPTHLVKQVSDRETLVKRVTIVPLEVIVRNVAAGSFSKRYGVQEGTVLISPTLEFSYKDDDLGDPLINTYHAFAVNDILKEYLLTLGIKLIDFKLEFGKTSDGTIVLADEISPDTCRFWDAETNEKLDKDRFRRDMGGVEDAYHEIMKRLMGE